ncbi:type III-B CRISPR module RAMP protein Cmr4 [Aliarcobacter butzleri]|uniref:type III-B CRISPR module RAMP protein Cmr4 n=1 Tax=Aliarcobacter butzleri TaxID=28197 RepID=UPI003B2141EA
MLFQAKQIFIKTKTNLHVGDSGTNFDIVDKKVQRDSISELPIINASSLKGAIKDYMRLFVIQESKNLDNIDKEAFDKIFGDDMQGLIRFLDSILLFIPLRANNKPFYYVTSKDSLINAIEFFESLGIKIKDDTKQEINKLKDNVVLNSKENAFIEDTKCEPLEIDIEKLLSFIPLKIRPKNIAIFKNDDFIDVVKHLPIIARNKLKDGKSDNLWYEEIVPRESIFYTAMLDYNNFGTSSEFKYKKRFEAFYNILQKEFVQVGANASIGFGLCKFDIVENKNV